MITHAMLKEEILLEGMISDVYNYIKELPSNFYKKYINKHKINVNKINNELKRSGINVTYDELETKVTDKSHGNVKTFVSQIKNIWIEFKNIFNMDSSKIKTASKLLLASTFIYVIVTILLINIGKMLFGFTGAGLGVIVGVLIIEPITMEYFRSQALKKSAVNEYTLLDVFYYMISLALSYIFPSLLVMSISHGIVKIIVTIVMGIFQKINSKYENSNKHHVLVSSLINVIVYIFTSIGIGFATVALY